MDCTDTGWSRRRSSGKIEMQDDYRKQQMSQMPDEVNEQNVVSQYHIATTQYPGYHLLAIYRCVSLAVY